jgi:hypothetical protein
MRGVFHVKFGDIGRFNSSPADDKATFMVISDRTVFVIADTDDDKLFVSRLYGIVDGKLMGDEVEWLDT